MPPPKKPVYANFLSTYTLRFTHVDLDAAFDADKDKYGPAKVFVDRRGHILLTTNNKIPEVIFNGDPHSYKLIQQFSYFIADSAQIADLLEDICFKLSIQIKRKE